MANSYTDEQRTEALRIFDKDGATAAAAVIGCSRMSVYQWVRDAVSTDTKNDPDELAHDQRYRQRLRTSLQRRMLEHAHDLLDRINQPHVEWMNSKDGPVAVTYDVARSSDVQRYITSMAICVDKYRLEMGEATGRLETMSTVDAELERMAREFNRTLG